MEDNKVVQISSESNATVVSFKAVVICDVSEIETASSQITGFIEEIESSMGYFGLNGFIDLGFTRIQMLIGVFLTFFVAFLLGIILANIIRKIKKVEF